MSIYNQIKDCLCGNYIGGAKEANSVVETIKNNKKEIMKEYEDIKNLSQEELISKIIELEAKQTEQNKLLEEERKKTQAEVKKKQQAERALEGALAEKKGELMVQKDIEVFNLLNLFRFFNKYDEGLLYHPDEEKRKKDEEGNFIIDKALYEYDPLFSAFDKNIDNYRLHQQRFIKDWSVSAQELVIMYYGVGTGKTLIAITAAEEYVRLNTNSYVYFVMPSSLVLNTILEMFKFGIDPTIKDDEGNNIYNFISYAQLLRTKYDFRDNSLLIVDEIHNLRNLYTQEISIKVSARKWKPSGNYSLVGSVLAEQLLDNSHNFIRKIFMTGTLFVNSSRDLEPIIAIGYNKRPLLKLDKDEYMTIMTNEEAFKEYYEGLVSFYRISGDEKKKMPTAEYHFPIIDMPSIHSKSFKKDPYFINTRTLGIEEKIEWIINFLKNHKNEKTLIYTQFLDRSLRPLTKTLEYMNIDYAVISGELSQEEKMEVVGRYNRDEVKILIFTLAIKEGISFKETNNFIVYNPYWNYAILEQIIARGIRLNSHKKGYKSIINVYLICVASHADKTDKEHYYNNPREWAKIAEEIMNNDIKTLKFEKNEKGEFMTPFHYTFGSRDIDLYNRMFNKQGEINDFEGKILKLPSFEEVNNNENSEFLKIYNEALLDFQRANGKLPTNKQMIELKRNLYREFYQGIVNETNNKIKRFTEDTQYRTSRNPDLQEIADFTNYPDLEDEIRKLLSKNASLDKIFEKFGIDKTMITTFQANFTPLDQIRNLLELSGIKNNKKDKIKILEGTAGIGNVVSGLMELNNRQNFMIDCNELNKVFFQVGKVLYEDLDNVYWYNNDFMNYVSKYNYDYLIGNPPFNLRTTIKGKATTLYDIDFIEKAYNMLNDDGILAFIISSRFQRDQSQHFKNFNTYLDEIKKVDENNVIIEPLETGFKKDKGLAKEMETNYGMVYIIIKKLPSYYMDLSKPNSAIFDTKDRIAKQQQARIEKMNKDMTEKKPRKKKSNEGIEENEEDNEAQPEKVVKKKKETKAEVEAKKKALEDKIKESIIQEETPKNDNKSFFKEIEEKIEKFKENHYEKIDRYIKNDNELKNYIDKNVQGYIKEHKEKFLYKKDKIENNSSLSNDEKLKNIREQERLLKARIEDSIKSYIGRVKDLEDRKRFQEEEKQKKIKQYEEELKAKEEKAKAKAEEKAKAKAEEKAKAKAEKEKAEKEKEKAKAEKEKEKAKAEPVAKKYDEKSKEAKAERFKKFNEYKQDDYFLKTVEDIKELEKDLENLKKIDTSNLKPRTLTIHNNKIKKIKEDIENKNGSLSTVMVKYREKYLHPIYDDINYNHDEEEKKAKAQEKYMEYKKDPEYIKLENEEKELYNQLKELKKIDTSKLNKKAESNHIKNIREIEYNIERNEKSKGDIEHKYRLKYKPIENKRRR
jgi:hypothetical protein